MHSVQRSFAICLLGLTALLLNQPAAGADNMNFAIIQPGQPGTTQDAQPVMDALTSYLQERLNPEWEIQGIYYNKLSDALRVLENAPPRWGIVSLSFYVEFADRFHMHLLASTRPGGFDKDIWRLVTLKDNPQNWQDLHGTVGGTMLFDSHAATLLLFGDDIHVLPFALQGTFKPLELLRAVYQGSKAGAILDRIQFEAAKSLPCSADLKTIYKSPPLPTSPVVSFGPPDQATRRLTRVLRHMSEDPNAAALLRLLQTDGFGPIDQDLPKLKLKDQNDQPVGEKNSSVRNEEPATSVRSTSAAAARKAGRN